MERDDLKIIGVFVALGIVLIGGYVFAYKVGRYLERKELTSIFIDGVQVTYYEGRGDAEKDCRAGLIK